MKRLLTSKNLKRAVVCILLSIGIGCALLTFAEPKYPVTPQQWLHQTIAFATLFIVCFAAVYRALGRWDKEVDEYLKELDEI